MFFPDEDRSPRRAHPAAIRSREAPGNAEKRLRKGRTWLTNRFRHNEGVEMTQTSWSG